ncbi:hypothetical protein BDR03DRAFT_944695 [Suillus americanus]|nr:hypothetical protein BDR03DRAFT_944695 [Suillus americanus]
MIIIPRDRRAFHSLPPVQSNIPLNSGSVTPFLCRASMIQTSCKPTSASLFPKCSAFLSTSKKSCVKALALVQS